MDTISSTTTAAAERVELTVSDGTRMLAYVARPKTPVKGGPGIVILQEAYGVNTFLREVTQRFADELNCLAIAPELYHRTGDGAIGDYNFDPPDMKPQRKGLSVEGQAADFVAAWEWLRSEGVPAERTATMGFCMGGRVAFLGNAQVPLGAAISLYGGRIAPDWAEFAGKQHGPLLCFWGGLDPHIPPEQRRLVEDTLNAATSVPHTHVVFSDANHGYFRHVRDDVYHPGAARETWAMLVAFLKHHKILD